MLKLNNLCAKKGSFELDSLNFCIEEGEIVGLIGRNGSGKTTTIQCLSGQYPLSSGSFTVFDKKLWQMSRAELERMALIDASTYLYKVNCKGERLLKYLSKQYSHFDKEKYLNLMNRLGLDGNKTPASFSLGQYELFLFAVAIAGGVQLILVDETLSAIDPIGKEILFEILREFTGQGGSMLITSHILSDLDRICDRLIIIENGKIRMQSSPDEIKEHFAVIDVSEEALEAIPGEAIISCEKEKLSYSLLVKKELVNPAYINRTSNLEEIVTKILKCEKEGNDNA